VVIRGQEGEITLNAKPKIERINIYDPFFLSSSLSFTCGELVLEVKNEGDSPFFAENATVKVWANGKEVLVDVRRRGFIPPNETGSVEIDLEGWAEPVDYEELIDGFDIRVSVDGEEAVYKVPPLAPKIEVMDVKTNGVVISITNNWIFPITTDWIEMYVEGQPIKFHAWHCDLDPNETEPLRVDFIDDVKIDSTVEIRLGCTSVKVKV